MSFIHSNLGSATNRSKTNVLDRLDHSMNYISLNIYPPSSHTTRSVLQHLPLQHQHVRSRYCLGLVRSTRKVPVCSYDAVIRVTEQEIHGSNEVDIAFRILLGHPVWVDIGSIDALGEKV